MARAKGLPVISRKLTADQKRRGVIFSSMLVENRNQKDVGKGLYEVKANDPNAQGKIELLKDSSFFAHPESPFRYNITRS